MVSNSHSRALKESKRRKRGWIMCSWGHGMKKNCWEVSGYAVLPNRFEDGVYHSDHRAVVTDVLLK